MLVIREELMLSETALLANIILAAIATLLSLIAIYFYFKGTKKFVGGEFRSYALWMLLGVIMYTLHLFLHLLEEADMAGWINVNETAVSFGVYIFLVIVGIFFLVGSYFYLKLSYSIGYKR